MSEQAERWEGARKGAGGPEPASADAQTPSAQAQAPSPFKSPQAALRGWIVLLASVSALAGFAAGLLVAMQFGPDPEPTGAFARYREAIVQEFDLSPERERVLASVLDEYARQLEDLQARGLRPLGDEQAKRGLRIHEMIRDRIIPSDQRDRFLELSSLEASPF